MPADSPSVRRALDALKDLDRETERVHVKGRVLAPAAETNTPVAPARAWVMAGEWGNEPPVVTGEDGVFRASRRRAGQLEDGRGYVLVYAEHPSRAEAAVAVMTEADKAAQDVLLEPVLTVSGRVVDRGGRPLDGARLRVLALKRVERKAREADKAEAPAGEWVAVPMDRLMPPVLSDKQGAFVVDGLVPGMRYTFMAERPGYALERPLTLDTVTGIPDGGQRIPWRRSALLAMGAITMGAVGELSLKGRVADVAGHGVAAAVSVWTLPPIVQAVAATNSDDDGRFVFRDIRENVVTLKAEASGYGVREVTGLKPMGQEVDLVLRKAGTEREAEETPAAAGVTTNATRRTSEGEVTDTAAPSPAVWLPALTWLRGMPPNGEAPGASDLSGKVVVLGFASSYVESSLKQLYPAESGLLSRLQKEFEGRGLLCVWILPRADDSEGGRKLALESGGEHPIAVDGKGEVWPLFAVPSQGGYAVLDRNGILRCVCSGGQVFKVVKTCLGR